jgi:integrase
MASVRVCKGREKWYMTGCKGTEKEFCLATPFDHSPDDKEQKKENKESALNLAKVTEAIKLGKPAEKIEPKLRGLMNEIMSAASKISLVMWLIAWVRWHCLSRNLSVGRTFCLSQIVGRFAAFIKSEAGLAKPKIQLGQVTSADVVSFLQHVHDTYHLSPGSVNFYHRTLKCAFQCAVTGRIISINPVSPILKMNEDKDSTRLPFAVEEVLKVLTICKTWGARGKEWEFAIRIAVGTAIRQSDICNLQPSNFRWDGGIPRIVYKPGKLKKYGREEVVRLSEELAVFVQGYLQNLDSNAEYCTPMLAHRCTGSRSVSFGSLLKAAGISRQWIIKGARKISRKTFHSFRHMVISILRANGCTLDEVMDFAGHTTIASSLNYTHKLPGWDLAKARAQQKSASKTPSLGNPPTHSAANAA